MKPVNTSTKDWLVELASKELEIEERICNRVISWSYIMAIQAMKNNNSVELSGFGKFIPSTKKTERKIKYRRMGIDLLQEHKTLRPERADKYETKIQTYLEDIEWLKTKISSNEASVEGYPEWVEK